MNVFLDLKELVLEAVSDKTTQQLLILSQSYKHTDPPPVSSPLRITSDRISPSVTVENAMWQPGHTIFPQLVFIVLGNWNIVWNREFIHSSCDAGARALAHG